MIMINWSTYFLGFLVGLLFGPALFGLTSHNFKFKNKKIAKLVEDFDKAIKYNIEGIHHHREDIDIYRYDLPFIGTTIELDMYAKDIRIIGKPDDIDEIKLFEYITHIQNQIHDHDSVNETMTRLLT